MLRRALPLLLLSVAGCSTEGLCGDEIIETKPDLEGTLVAYHVVRDCGATTDFATHVLIGKRGEDIKHATRVFTADSGHGAADRAGNSIWMEMGWTRPHHLSVAYAGKARVFLSDPQARGATITYRATVRAAPLPTAH